MRFFLLLLLLPVAAYAGVHRQEPSQLIEPAIASPTFINELPAAVDVTPVILHGPSETLSVVPGPLMSPTVVVSTSRSVSGAATAVSPTVLAPAMVAQQQCVNGFRILTQLALVAYDAEPNRVFMRIAADSAIDEPYAANGVPPKLDKLQAAMDDMPVNTPGVKEIGQAFSITKTACSSIVKPK